MKKFNFRKIEKRTLAISLGMILLFTAIIAHSPETVYATDFIDIAVFEDEDFGLMGVTETIVLEMDCDTVSVYGECENGGSETIFLHLVKKDNPNVSISLPFTANGSSVWTSEYNLTEGRYYAWFTGTSSNIKSYAIATFTVWEE